MHATWNGRRSAGLASRAARLCPAHSTVRTYGLPGALRRARARLVLQTGDEFAQRRSRRLASSRGTRPRRGHGRARIDLLETPTTRDVSPSADDAIREHDA